MKCIICNEFRGAKIPIIYTSSRAVCFKCIPELVDSYITLRERNWIIRRTQK